MTSPQLVLSPCGRGPGEGPGKTEVIFRPILKGSQVATELSLHFTLSSGWAPIIAPAVTCLILGWVRFS